MGAPSPRDDSRFEAILANRPEATFFHTRAWARIVTAAFPQIEDCSTILRVEGEPYAVPLFRWRRLGGLLATRHSSFPFLYGGPIPARAVAFGALLERLARGRDALVVIGNPFAGPMTGAAAALPTAAAGDRLPAVAETTHVLALPRSIEAFWEQVLTSRKRNDIRRLTQKGVTVELARDTAAAGQVYALYRRRMSTWAQRPGFVYPPRFYPAMLEHGGDAVRLYVARFEGRVIGGAFITRWNGIAHYNAGYFDDDARALRPNVLIQERIIRDAIADGYHTYDMLPSAGLRPVEEFKESFGGVRTSFPRWERLGAWHRLAHGLRRGRSNPKARKPDGE